MSRKFRNRGILSSLDTKPHLSGVIFNKSDRISKPQPPRLPKRTRSRLRKIMKLAGSELRWVLFESEVSFDQEPKICDLALFDIAKNFGLKPGHVAGPFITFVDANNEPALLIHSSGMVCIARDCGPFLAGMVLTDSTFWNGAVHGVELIAIAA